MLTEQMCPHITDFDQQVYRIVVPQDHYLVNAMQVIPWDEFIEPLAVYYSPDKGRPPYSPVFMLKLEYLRYHYNLSDREVIHRVETDLAFRCFLQLPLHWRLPEPSLLCQFRGRLGKNGFRQIFDRVVRTARELGFVKDRLRIKDATHVIGNLAVPTALALVAQTRDKLLSAAELFAAEMVEGERVNLEMLREATKSLAPTERLVTRLAQLREMLLWIDAVSEPPDAQANRFWERFLTQRDLAHKILSDKEHPGAGDRTLSTTDPDVRCGKHGAWFDGYLMDILVDADSEIITQVNVLAANGNEAADAIDLLQMEEAAHGNDVQAISIDGAGFSGPLLRQLQDPDGLNVDTYVPTPQEQPSDEGLFGPRDFIEDTAQGTVTCPAGQTSSKRFYDKQKQAVIYRFAATTCQQCPLADRCMKKAAVSHGRTVTKSDYQAEHERARKKTQTPEYHAVRREHPKVERKLGEIMNRHGGRRARYRGQAKVLIQQLMACMATNVKRIVRLACAPIAVD